MERERDEGRRVPSADVITLLFNPVVAKAVRQFQNISKFDSRFDTGRFEKNLSELDKSICTSMWYQVLDVGQRKTAEE